MMKFLILCFVTATSLNSFADEDFCKERNSRLSNVCNTSLAHNRFGICMTKTSEGIVVKVARYAGVRWGFDENAPALLYSRVDELWAQPKPTDRDWERQETQFLFRVVEDGKHAQLISVYPKMKVTPWVEDLVDCPSEYLFAEQQSFLP